MKKIMLFLFLVVSTSVFCQVKDSIFLKNGKVLVVEQVMPFTFIPKVRPLDYPNECKFHTTVQNDFIPVQDNTPYYGVTFYKILGDTVTIHTIKTSEISRLYIRMEDVNYLNEYNFYKLNKQFKSTEDYKIEYIKYNLGKYYKQVRLGQYVVYGGVALSGLSVLIRNDEDNTLSKISLISGGAMTLIGAMIGLDSYKWIKRASLKTNLNSVSLNLKF